MTHTSYDLCSLLPTLTTVISPAESQWNLDKNKFKAQK